MIAFAMNIFGYLCVGTLLFSLVLLFFSLAMLLQMMPQFLRVLRRLLRGILILTYRLYRMAFTFLQPLVKQELGLDIMAGFARLGACVVLSMIPGIIFLILFLPPMDILIFALCILHGIVLGLAWDDIENPGGLQLGVDAS